MSLTPKQEDFANKYVELGNASEAFRQAYPHSRKWGDNTLWVEASRTLNKPKVALRIKELQEQAEERSNITKDEAVQVLVDMVAVNPLDYVGVESEGEVVVKNLDELTESQQKAIKSITPTANGVRVEFYDKTVVLNQLGKMLGWDSPTKHEFEGMIQEISREDAIRFANKLREGQKQDEK